MSTTANYFSTSNSTLSLPHSSSTFANLSKQSDTYKREEPEIYDDDNDDGDDISSIYKWAIISIYFDLFIHWSLILWNESIIV